jgi:uncharacterized protein (TIGR02145 family)
VYQGAVFNTPPLTATTIYYVSVLGTGVCENEVNDRKPVTVTVEVCKMIDCEAMEDKFVEEDGYREFKYTHVGNGWDIVLMTGVSIDYVCYFLNDELLSCGVEATLDGVEFPIGVSVIKVISYFSDKADSCEFNVTVVRVCPSEIPDNEGNIYKVTKLAGLCWTENLKATKYAVNLGEGEIPFANPYTCSTCPEDLEETFGLLYTWYSAVNDGSGRSTFVQGICPEFWHVPAQEEWNLLSGFDAKALRSAGFWIDPPGPGTDLFGWEALPAGWYNGTASQFVDLYGFAGWWAADDEPGMPNGNGFNISYFCDIMEKNPKKKLDGLSVRCVMD